MYGNFHVNKKTNIEIIIEKILIENKVNYLYNYHLPFKKKHFLPDFLIENKKLIIECDGLYWHSSACKVKRNYHERKFNAYKYLGFRSLFFRTDEIIDKYDVVKSIINHYLDLNQKIDASKCSTILLDKTKSEKFFKTNSLKDYESAKTYGLIFKNKVVYAMRVIENKQYLIIEDFCNVLNTRVENAFATLLNIITQNNKINKISCTIDLRFDNENILINNGFKEISNELDYKLTNGSKTFNKNAVEDLKKYHKIWDCGQKTFELTTNNDIEALC